MKLKIILCICFLFLTGCVARQSEPLYRVEKAKVVYKNNVNSEVGEISAVYKNRIYYFSQEKNVSGIYSMETDGNDIQLEVPSKDVKKIQIVDDLLYFLDFDSIYYGDKNSSEKWGNKFYHLKALNLNSKDIISFADMEKKISDTMYSETNQEERYRGIWDYSYLGNHDFFVTTLQVGVPTGRFVLKAQIFENGNPILWEDENFDIFDQYIDSQETKGVLYKKGNIYLLSALGPTYDEYDMKMDAFSIFDIDNNVSSYSCDSILYTGNLPVIYSIKDNELVLLINDSVYKYDVQKNKILQFIAITGATEINMHGEYLIVSFDDRTEIYLFDKELFSIEKINTNTEGKIINVYQGYYVILNENSISKRKISDDHTVWEMETTNNYLSNEYTVEICGDWLFIKLFDIQKEQGILVEKINLSNGKRLSENLEKK